MDPRTASRDDLIMAWGSITGALMARAKADGDDSAIRAILKGGLDEFPDLGDGRTLPVLEKIMVDTALRELASYASHVSLPAEVDVLMTDGKWEVCAVQHLGEDGQIEVLTATGLRCWIPRDHWRLVEDAQDPMADVGSPHPGDPDEPF